MGIAVGRRALRLDEDRPARSQTAQRVVETAGDRDEFGRRRGVQIRPTKPCGPLKRPILVENDAFAHQRRPGQEIGETLRFAAVFGEIQHR